MSLLEADFAKAIECFVSAWRVSSIGLKKVESEDEHGKQSGWDDVQVAEKFGAQYLRITKHISTRTEQVAGNGNHGVHESEDEIEDEMEDEDPEALFIPAAAAKRKDFDRVARYDVVYSPFYQVPVLYLTFANASTSKSLTLPPAEEIYDMLVPQNLKTPIRDIGVIGALSMAEHPITGMPAYFVHPCRTQEALAPLLPEDASHKTGFEPAVEYLLLWFGVIGASVGLSVPVNTARLLAEG